MAVVCQGHTNYDIIQKRRIRHLMTGGRKILADCKLEFIGPALERILVE